MNRVNGCSCLGFNNLILKHLIYIPNFGKEKCCFINSFLLLWPTKLFVSIHSKETLDLNAGLFLVSCKLLLKFGWNISKSSLCVCFCFGLKIWWLGKKYRLKKLIMQQQEGWLFPRGEEGYSRKLKSFLYFVMLMLLLFFSPQMISFFIIQAQGIYIYI